MSKEATPPAKIRILATSPYTGEALVRREVRNACTQPPVPPVAVPKIRCSLSLTEF